MKGSVTRMSIKRIILLLIIVALAITLILTGIFLMNYTTDEITSISHDTYYEWEWETQRPYEGLGMIFVVSGAILLVLAVLSLLIGIYKKPNHRKL